MRISLDYLLLFLLFLFFIYILLGVFGAFFRFRRFCFRSGFSFFGKFLLFLKIGGKVLGPSRRLFLLYFDLLGLLFLFLIFRVCFCPHLGSIILNLLVFEFVLEIFLILFRLFLFAVVFFLVFWSFFGFFWWFWYGLVIRIEFSCFTIIFIFQDPFFTFLAFFIIFRLFIFIPVHY